MIRSFILILFLFTLVVSHAVAQETPAQPDTLPLMQWDEPKEYEISGLEISGVYNSDPVALKSVTGLRVGDKIRIPGPDIQQAMLALWRLRLFEDVQIIQDSLAGDHIYLRIDLKERPRLTKYAYEGAKKSEHDNLNDVVKPFLIKGQIVTEDMKLNAVNAIKRYYKNKGYFDVEVSLREEPDPQFVNAISLVFEVDQNPRIKIATIDFRGNDNVKSKKLRKLMKETKKSGRIFSKSKLVIKDYEADKDAVIAHYNTIGFRDAEVVEDSIWRGGDGRLNILLKIDEGNKYFFRDITWKGNSLYSDERLSTVLGIEKGDVYNAELLEYRLRFSPDGRDVSSLYLDDGYLFFDIQPVEVAVENDSIDLEMRIFEGPQATIDKVIIEGNDRTHEHVIRRELRTLPGQKFSRSDIIRSQRQIINLGFFNPEALDIQTPVDPARGTVDIVYKVEEQPADQLELSAGWGGFGRSSIIGTLGVSFNNFSLRNIFNREAWHPLPQGDGQKLSLRAQTNGDFFQSYNFSFTEPWLGGKKPTSFSLGAVHTAINNEFFQGGKLSITRFFTGIGTRLKWPDDNFVFNGTVNLEAINLDDYLTPDFVTPEGDLVTNGKFNNYSLTLGLTRTTVAEPIFPRSGSRISLTLQLTPPYSALGREIDDISDPEQRYKWVEYHKWRFDAEWYAPLGASKFVVMARAKLGFLGFYNAEIGIPPFERFEVGGDGISNQNVGILGKDIFALRGYEVQDLQANLRGGGSVFNKFTIELRYPVSLQPTSTIFVLGFLEGGNNWNSFSEFNPFDLRRSAGIGARIFLPMFGLLGFDYGWGFDKPTLINNNARWSDFGKFSIILGFEPD